MTKGPWFALLLVVACAGRSWADRLPAHVVPSHYDLTFDVDLPHERFDGTATIRVDVAQPTDRIELHALDLTIHHASIAAGSRVDAAAVRMDPARQTSTLVLSRPIPAGPATIEIRYGARLNRELRGLYVSRANGRRYAISQMESTDARRAFPCFDEPALKATFAIRLTVDRRDIAISNGPLIADTPGPGANRHTLTFATTPKMSTYLVAIAVGDFTCLEDRLDRVPIRVCATPDKASLGSIALDAAKQILSFYNDYFSIKYPFEKLDIVAAPDFSAGAMENLGAIFYRETALLTDSRTASPAERKAIWSYLAHEMAHQWFGDLVTMRWWDDIWLNEGFATWMANRPMAARNPEWDVPVDEAVERETALDFDSFRSTRPIHASAETPGEIEELFDPIAYQKGAAVLRMIEAYVGPDAFKRGVNVYLEKHAYGNATSEDFSVEMTAVSGKPIDRVLVGFVNQPGAPLLDASLACESGRTQVTVRQERLLTASPGSERTDEAKRWQIPICATTPGHPNAACTLVASPSAGLPLPDGRCAPWVFVNADAHGYFRTAYPPDVLRAIAPDIETALNAPERLALAGDEWALVVAGRHSVTDYLTVASGFAAEHTSGVLDEVAKHLRFIREHFANGAAASKYEAFVRTLFQPLAQELGFRSVGGETEDRRALRAIVVDALGTIGNDPDVIGRARVVTEQALGVRTPQNETTGSRATSSEAFDPALANSWLRIAARHGDRALYDAVASAAERASTPEEHYRFLYALPEFQDPPLIRRALELAPTLRSQDTAIYLSRLLANPAARTTAWGFIKRHWTTLEPKIDISLGDVNLVTALGAFCDPESRDDIRSFFSTRRLPAASRTFDQTFERINACAAAREKQAPALVAWLDRH